VGGFNSSVGILVVRTRHLYHGACPSPKVSIPRSEFWSFGRCFVHLVQGRLCLFQFLGRNSGRSDLGSYNYRIQTRGVSIPRSEFWSFGQRWCVSNASNGKGFNSSVGILVVRTMTTVSGIETPKLVSIPRSEFWSFGQRSKTCYGVGIIVSIPRSEFWSFGHIAKVERYIGRKMFQFLGRNSGRSDAP